MAGIDKSQGKLIFPPRFVPYLEKHRIFELFHELAELLVQKMPKDHVRFLREMLPCAAKKRDKPRIVLWTPPTFDRVGFAHEIADVLGIMEITRNYLEVNKKNRILMTNIARCGEMKFLSQEEEDLSCISLPEYYGEYDIPKIICAKLLAESETSEIPEEGEEEREIEEEKEIEEDKEMEEENQGEKEMEEENQGEKEMEEENQGEKEMEEENQGEKEIEEENQGEKEMEEENQGKKETEEENEEEERQYKGEENKLEENQEREKEEDKEEEIMKNESEIDKDPCKGFRVCRCKNVQLPEEVVKKTDENEIITEIKMSDEGKRNEDESDEEKIGDDKVECSVNQISKYGSDSHNNSVESKMLNDNFSSRTSITEAKISKDDSNSEISNTESKIPKDDFSYRTSSAEARISRDDFSSETSNTEAKIPKDDFSCRTSDTKVKISKDDSSDTDAKTEEEISIFETSCVCESSLREVFIDYGALGKCEYVEKGWILVDFPKDAEEAEQLCAKGALPTHAIHLIADTEEETTRQYKYMLQDWKTVYQNIPVMDIHISGRSNAELAKDICKLLRIMPHRHAPMLPRVVLIGCRGSGATTQAKLLSRKYKMVHGKAIAQVLLQDDNLSERYRLQKITRPDPELEAAILERILLTPPCRKRGWVLTGYPTTIDQMYMLDLIVTPPNRVIFIEVPAKECFIRLYYRKTDWTDGKEYKLPDIKPFGLEARDAAGIDPEIAKRLLSHPRNDKRQIIHDIEEFFEEKEIIMKYCGRTATYVNGSKSIDTVFELIDQVIINPAPAESARDPLAVNYGIQEAYKRLKNIRMEGGITGGNLLKNPPDPTIKF